MDEANQISFSAELVRKGIHLFALTIPIGYIFVSLPLAIFWVGLSTAVSFFIDFSRFRKWMLWSWLANIMGSIFREHEMKGGLSGATYILVTALVTIIVFPKTIAIAALTFIIIGDTAAAIVGRRYGKHRLIGRKSLEGSAACLISLSLISVIIPGLPYQAGFAGAAAATLTELLSGKVDDNLTVPMVSGIVMIIVMRLMGLELAIFSGALQVP